MYREDVEVTFCRGRNAGDQDAHVGQPCVCRIEAAPHRPRRRASYLDLVLYLYLYIYIHIFVYIISIYLLYLYYLLCISFVYPSQLPQNSVISLNTKLPSATEAGSSLSSYYTTTATTKKERW